VVRLAEAREAFAEALNAAVDGLDVRPRPGQRTPRQGSGWVVLGGLKPSDYTRSEATLVAVVVLGVDVESAEALMDTWAVILLDAATSMDELPFGAASVEPVSLPVDGQPLSAITITITTEVEP